MEVLLHLALYYLTLGYSREKNDPDKLHLRLILLLAISALTACVTGVFMWQGVFVGSSGLILLVVIGAVSSFAACFCEIRCFKFSRGVSIQYWPVASFVILYCSVSLLPQILS